MLLNCNFEVTLNLLLQDLELAEYKKSGLKLSRRDLATKEFVPGEYRANYTAKLSSREPSTFLIIDSIKIFEIINICIYIKEFNGISNRIEEGNLEQTESLLQCAFSIGHLQTKKLVFCHVYCSAKITPFVSLHLKSTETKTIPI